MLFEVWKTEDNLGISYIFQPNNTNKHIIEPNATLLITIEAENWNDGMIKYNNYMGYEPYLPIEE